MAAMLQLLSFLSAPVSKLYRYNRMDSMPERGTARIRAIHHFGVVAML
jgi:hypothetical protein